jgi:hypothetical protein
MSSSKSVGACPSHASARRPRLPSWEGVDLPKPPSRRRLISNNSPDQSPKIPAAKERFANGRPASNGDSISARLPQNGSVGAEQGPTTLAADVHRKRTQRSLSFEAPMPTNARRAVPPRSRSFEVQPPAKPSGGGVGRQPNRTSSFHEANLAPRGGSRDATSTLGAAVNKGRMTEGAIKKQSPSDKWNSLKEFFDGRPQAANQSSCARTVA